MSSSTATSWGSAGTVLRIEHRAGNNRKRVWKLSGAHAGNTFMTFSSQPSIDFFAGIFRRASRGNSNSNASGLHLSILREKPRLEVSLGDITQGLTKNRMKRSRSEILVQGDSERLLFTILEDATQFRVTSACSCYVESKTGERPQHFTSSERPQLTHEASITS